MPMKAVVCTKYGPPEVLRLKEMEKPAPKENEICIKVFASSVTASDCIIRGFKVPMRFWLPMALAIGIKKPRKSILGMVFAGEVESVGANAQTFTKGDRVYGIDRFGFGSYAEYKCMREDGILVKGTANVKYEEAAAIPFGGLLALHYLKKEIFKKDKNTCLRSFGSSRHFSRTACKTFRGGSNRGVQYCKFGTR